MGEVGIFFGDDWGELLEGYIIEMASIGGRHFTCVNRLTDLDERSEPQPDLALLERQSLRRQPPKEARSS